MTEPILKIQNIKVRYAGLPVIHGISMNMNRGETVCVVGSNGAGKSTTLMTIFGVERAARGEIQFKGKPIHHLRPDQVAARGVSQAPEGRQIFPKMSTLENLEMGAFLRRDKAGVANDLEGVFELFPVLKDRVNQLGGTLSVGEQEMLAVGRALMSSPRLLILDEPSLGLGPIIIENLFQVLHDINAEGVTILLVEQNAVMALEYSHRAYVLENGRVTLSGSSKELACNEDVRNAYLGGA